MKSILFVLHRLYGGGSEKVVNILAQELSKKYDITIAYYYDIDKQYDLDNKCLRIRLPFRDPDNRSVFYRMYSLIRQVRALKRIKRDRKADVSIAMLVGPCLVNILSGGHCVNIGSERNNPKKGNYLYYLASKIIYRCSDAVIFQSKAVQNLYGRAVRDKSLILKNPITVPVTADNVRAHRIVTLGRLVPQKNHALLIRSFAAFHKKHPEYTLSIYGEDWLRETLQNQIDSLGLSGSVFLEGNHLNVHEKIRDAEMFVLSSDYEGFSNALLECMAMGIACISTKCEGATDVIRHMENGLLTDIGDEKGLTDAMIMLAEDPALRRKLEEQAAADLKAYEKGIVVKEWEETMLRLWENKYGKKS